MPHLISKFCKDVMRLLSPPIQYQFKGLLPKKSTKTLNMCNFKQFLRFKYILSNMRSFFNDKGVMKCSFRKVIIKSKHFKSDQITHQMLFPERA